MSNPDSLERIGAAEQHEDNAEDDSLWVITPDLTAWLLEERDDVDPLCILTCGEAASSAYVVADAYVVHTASRADDADDVLTQKSDVICTFRSGLRDKSDLLADWA